MKRGTPKHPKVYDLCERLNCDRPTALGYLELLWHFTAEFCPQGDIGRFSDKRIEGAVEWVGRGKQSGKLIEALIEVGFVDVDAEVRLLIHDWSDHADESVRKRLQRAGLSFHELTPKVTGQSPDTDGIMSASLADSGSLARALLPLPLPLPPPIVPQGGPCENLFGENETAAAPGAPAPKKKKTVPAGMSAEQRKWFGEYLNTHPKNTLQPVKAEQLWREKVTDAALAQWLIENLKRECAGDTTYLRGPWRWLEDHLTLYANGAKANLAQDTTAPPRPHQETDEERRAREAKLREELAPIKAKMEASYKREAES